MKCTRQIITNIVIIIFIVLIHHSIASEEWKEWKKKWKEIKSRDKDEKGRGGEVRIVNRSLLLNGFHRILQSNLSFHFTKEEFNNKETTMDCTFLQVEELNNSFYVDKYQIRDEQDFVSKQSFISNSTLDAIQQIIMETIDLEKPSYLSSSNQIFLFTHFKNISFASSTKWTSNLPIHLRYHPPSNYDSEAFDTAIISNPSFYLSCKFPNERSTREDARWNRLEITQSSIEIRVHVPVGNSNHKDLVTVVTMFSSLLGCLLISYFTLTSNDTK
eukprot:TRINITY_DN6411_c0_g1_i2.p1 TRINITY_DN6411_c0_g1~~TRINITY_DN6411_c0_g1_i2.p1  ORF type:complete len:273 (+),score=90.54 TRINITY_DN6411_c0_g1_i2:159-977(+)